MYRRVFLPKRHDNMPVDSSRLKGFYKLSVPERRSLLSDIAGLDERMVEAWASNGELSEEVADRMIENVIGTYSLPIGVATNFIIDGEHYLIPFVVEEASVVAAASNMAKRCHSKGGFVSNNDEPVMIGQIQVVGCDDPEAARQAILSSEKELIDENGGQSFAVPSGIILSAAGLSMVLNSLGYF